MPDWTGIPIIVIILLAVVALAPLVDGVWAGWALTRALVRMIRGKRRGSKRVEWPQELRVAAANGLVGIGSELVVGQAAEWEDGRVKRYPIAMADCGEKPGTILTVVGMDEEKMEVVRVREI